MPTLRFKPEEVFEGGGQMGELLVKYRPDFETRVEPATINTIIEKVPLLRDAYATQADLKGDKAAATERKQQLCHDAAEFLSDCRNLVAKAFSDDPSTRKDFGLGRNLNPKSLHSVTTALTDFVKAAKAAPEKAKAASVIPADIERMEQSLTALKAQAQTQTKTAATAKDSTAARVALQAEIEDAMVKIAAAANLIYEKKPELRALFQSTLPARRSRRKGDKAAQVAEPTPEHDDGNETETEND